MGLKKPKVLSVLCGAITCGLHFFIIPLFFMRAVEDPIWVALMLLLPIIPAAVLLHVIEVCSPKSVFWSMLTECSLVLIFHRVIGGFLGYHLSSLTWDLFEYIAYLMFTLGLAIPTALIQFVALLLLSKYKCSKKM